MTERRPPLLKLPLEVLNEITKDFDIKDVCILRKICRQLRRYVDNNQALFDEKIESLTSESTDSDYIQFTFLSSDDQVLLRILYEKCQVGFRVESGFSSNYVENGDFATAAGNDLGLILKRQKRVLKKLQITKMVESDAPEESSTGRMIDSLVSHLEDRKVFAREIQLEDISKEENIFKIFSCVNPTFLEKLKIENYFDGHSSKDANGLKMDRIVSTKHWQGSETLHCELFCNTSLSNFHHFKNAKFKVESICSHDLLMLKKAKLQDPSFEKFEFEYRRLTGPGDLTNLLGEHCVTGISRQRWFYRIPNTEKALVLNWTPRLQMVKLEIKDVADLPANFFN